MIDASPLCTRLHKFAICAMMTPEREAEFWAKYREAYPQGGDFNDLGRMRRFGFSSDECNHMIVSLVDGERSSCTGKSADQIKASARCREASSPNELAPQVAATGARKFKAKRDCRAAFDLSQTPWFEKANRDKDGNPVCELKSAVAALRGMPELSACFAYDEMLCAEVLIAPVPGSVVQQGRLPRPVMDHDVLSVTEYLQGNGLPRLSNEIAYQAVELRARERSYHPVRDYLRALRWDGVPRIDNWLNYYFAAEQTEYTRVIGRCFLLSMVARAMRSGCKVDYILILEGPQGLLKSSACKILAGDWFSDQLPSLDTAKDASLHLRGKWLIEVAELFAMSRAESTLLKAFVTRESERYRPPYGRKEVIEPRQCVFIGTTNETIYLRDETGGRRFWPVKCQAIDIEALRADRDQLFAEAYQCLQLGEQWWPDPEFERTQIASEQANRLEVDAWEDPILKFAAERVNGKHPRTPKEAVLDAKRGPNLTILEVAQGALGMATEKLGTSEQRRIGKILMAEGWTRDRDRTGRYFAPPLKWNRRLGPEEGDDGVEPALVE
jgi:hypothetical protein